jgi:predicted MFS family arabinose efflux permease
MGLARSERAIVAVVAAVQFVNILDFMIVMPLGPDFAAALGIPVSRLGIIGGSYTVAAALAGIVGSFFLDRFDRRRALLTAMLGLIAGTALCAVARGMPSLVAARVVAGLFGGPATALAISIIADVIPPERRGRAMAEVMSVFSIASVLGVPAGLELAAAGGWRAPFIAVAALGLVVLAAAWRILPPLREHLEAGAQGGGENRLRSLLRQPMVLLSLTLGGAVMMGAFILIPNLAAYIMGNLGYPRERLGFLYLLGGALSFLAIRLAGPAVDRLGAFPVATAASGILLVVLYFGFVAYTPVIPVTAIFVILMFALSMRNVAYATLTSKVPRPAERARFMSIRSAVQHFAAGVGSFLSARMLGELPGGALEGVPGIALISMGIFTAVPALFWTLEARLRERDRADAIVARVDAT